MVASWYTGNTTNRWIVSILYGHLFDLIRVNELPWMGYRGVFRQMQKFGGTILSNRDGFGTMGAIVTPDQCAVLVAGKGTIEHGLLGTV
jgi:hypothetical protein